MFFSFVFFIYLKPEPKQDAASYLCYKNGYISKATYYEFLEQELELIKKN